MKPIRSGLALLLLSCLACSGLAETTLRFVAAGWRHGDRAPASGTFPTDTANGDETWPQGFGELSEAGMRQHQHLGAYIRKRYVIDEGFLSPNYSAREVYVRSTFYNRTIMSALSNLAGMYPTSSGVDMLQDIPIWQPIPIHSRPGDMDPMLWMDCPCPKADDIFWNEVMVSDRVMKVTQENQAFLDFLQNKTQMSRMTLKDVSTVWDPLNCERIYNDSHTWPDWVTEEIFENLTSLMHLSTTFYYDEPKLQRFRGSLFFNDIAQRFNQKVNHPETFPQTLKYYIYSTHDTTLIALMENLGAYNAHLPEYASAILFELHEKQPHVFTVETWYVNETLETTPPVRLIVKGCDGQPGVDCTLEKFVQIAGSNVPEDWYAECQLSPPNSTSTTSTQAPDVRPVCDNSAKDAATIAAIVLGVTTGILLLAFVVTLVLYCRQKKSSRIAHRTY